MTAASVQAWLEARLHACSEQQARHTFRGIRQRSRSRSRRSPASSRFHRSARHGATRRAGRRRPSGRDRINEFLHRRYSARGGAVACSGGIFVESLPTGGGNARVNHLGRQCAAAMGAPLAPQLERRLPAVRECLKDRAPLRHVRCDFGGPLWHLNRLRTPPCERLRHEPFKTPSSSTRFRRRRRGRHPGGRPGERRGARPTPQVRPAGRRAMNLVFMVADGMSYGTLTLADACHRQRYDRHSTWISLFNEKNVRRSTAFTYSADSLVTDSAAGATAWGIGERVNNKCVCFTPDNRTPTPLWLQAQAAGQGRRPGHHHDHHACNPGGVHRQRSEPRLREGHRGAVAGPGLRRRPRRGAHVLSRCHAPRNTRASQS